MMLGVKATGVVLVGAMVLTVAGCGSSGPTAVSDVAQRFYRAVESGDGAAACALLAPPTTAEIEQTAKTSCRTAILDEDLPDAGEVTGSQRYGGQAQVRLEGDTAFLSEFGDGWKVVAAGCTARGEAPYDCKVSG